MGENLDINNLNSNRINKLEVRDKAYKDKNIEKAIKDGVENYLDLAVLKLYSNNAVAEYEYINDYMFITTEILENGYVISDIHIDVNMIINDYMSKDDNKRERYIALDKNYLMGLNLKFLLKDIDDDIDNIETRYFTIYGVSNNNK